MAQSIPTALAEIEAQITALTARKQALKMQADTHWPKRLTLYAYCSSERNLEIGESSGLTGGALSLFVHFEEIELAVEVAEDGAVTILSCNGHAVVPDARPWVPQMDGDLEATNPNLEGNL